MTKLWKKIVLLILLNVTVLITAASSIGCVYLAENRIYDYSKTSHKYDTFYNMLQSEAYLFQEYVSKTENFDYITPPKTSDALQNNPGSENNYINNYKSQNTKISEYDYSESYSLYKNISSIIVKTDDATYAYTNSALDKEQKFDYTYYWMYDEYGYMGIYYSWTYEDLVKSNEPESIKEIQVTITIPSDLTKYEDELSKANYYIDIAYILRIALPISIIVFCSISIILFVLLINIARKTTKKAKAPMDIVSILLFLFTIACIFVLDEMSYLSEVFVFIAVGIGIILATTLYTMYFMSIASHLAQNNLIKSSMLYKLLTISIKLFKNIPFIIKSLSIFIFISVIEFLAIMIGYYEIDNLIVFWILEKCILFPAFIYISIVMKKLKNSCKIISEGDLEHNVDTSFMVLDFKEHGENLNKIQDVISASVDERTKSERMKTELITNVSHDLKTPLTSVINYSSLLCKDNLSNNEIKEYADALHRQSEKLKKLVDDLIEASKAASGNIEVNLEKCDLQVLISQICVEYEARFAEKNLSLVIALPESNINISADSRLLWRICDNMMSNIYKYAMSNTRVYITLEQCGNKAILVFKNISANEIKRTSTQLLERFVQDDSSRSSEGNGLGLSITKNLTELQSGSFNVLIDGDLFKAVFEFEII